MERELKTGDSGGHGGDVGKKHRGVEKQGRVGIRKETMEGVKKGEEQNGE